MILLAVMLSLTVAEPVNCAEVRAKVKEHGIRVSYLWALAKGLSPKEIARIRKQCGV